MFPRARILKNCHPGIEFSFSEIELQSFYYRKQIFPPTKKKTSQTKPDQFVTAIMKFHQKLLCERKPRKIPT